MTLLIISISIALLITIGLPIAAGIWTNRKLGLPWRIISYGVLGFLIVQALVALILSGFLSLVQNGTISLGEQALNTIQIWLSILLGVILGILMRWAGMKFIKESLDTPAAAFGIGVGYGGIESIMLVGLPLLSTFMTMLGNRNIDPQTTQLDPLVVEQIKTLWQVSHWVPLAGSLERIAAFVMHITVTFLILQVFRREKTLWILVAVGLELLMTGLVVGLSEAGLTYWWVVLVSVVFMIGNLYILYRLGAGDLNHYQRQAE